MHVSHLPPAPQSALGPPASPPVPAEPADPRVELKRPLPAWEGETGGVTFEPHRPLLSSEVTFAAVAGGLTRSRRESRLGVMWGPVLPQQAAPSSLHPSPAAPSLGLAALLPGLPAPQPRSLRFSRALCLEAGPVLAHPPVRRVH